MEKTIVEAVPSMAHDRSNGHKEKKKKSCITNAESNSGTDISSPEKSHMKGGVTLSPASDAYGQAGAQVSEFMRKESNQAPSIHSDGEAADAYQNKDQNAKTINRSGKEMSHITEAEKNSGTDDISSREKSGMNGDVNLSPAIDPHDQSGSQVPEPTIPGFEAADGNQNEDKNTKKRKRPRKKMGHIINAESNNGADNISLPENSHILSPANDARDQSVAQASQLPRKESDKAPSIHPVREAADGNKNEGQSAKKRKRPRQKMGHIINAESNNGADNISLPENSNILSPASDARDQSVAQASHLPRKESDKAPSIHPVREAADGNKNEGQSAKKRKRPRKKKGHIINAESNNGVDNISLLENSDIKEDIILSPASDSRDQSVAQASHLPRKESDKAPSIHPVREAADGNKNEGQSAKKRKRPRKKKGHIISSESNSGIYNISSPTKSPAKGDITLPPASDAYHHAGGAQVSQLARKESEALIIHPNREAANCNQNECKANKKKRLRKRNKTTLPTAGDTDRAEGTHVDRKADESIANGISNDVGNDTKYCDSAPSNAHVSSEQRNGGDPHRKLLILDLNGILADIRSSHGVKGFKADRYCKKTVVYKRPFVDDFLRFCFDNFDVGIWTSRKSTAMQFAVGALMRGKSERFLFCLDQSYCTNTGLHVIGCKSKPLFLKELKKLWNGELGIQKYIGGYNESNTLLVDDSPYKAVRNPPHTAIFPHPYEVTDTEDNSLGPNGELRLYLERLAKAENVQNFVKENPIGQPSIEKSNTHWDFYSKIIESVYPNNLELSDPCTSPPPVQGPKLGRKAFIRAKREEQMASKRIIGPLTLLETTEIESRKIINALKDMIGPLTLSQTKEMAAWEKKKSADHWKEMNALKNMIGPLTLPQTRKMEAWQKKNAPKHSKKARKQQRKNKQDTVNSASNKSHVKLEHPSEVGVTTT